MDNSHYRLCGYDRSVVNNLALSLGRVEHYDATQVRCLSFAKATDIVDGLNIRLTNMAGGFPFSFGGITWKDSETLYLCGEFSNGSAAHLAVQEYMHRQTGGYTAKYFVKARHREAIRPDFAEFRTQWMMMVIWCKCVGNSDFARLLRLLPTDAFIIEDCTHERCDTREIWGCSNPELAFKRAEVKREVVRRAKAVNPLMSKAALKRLVAAETCKVNGIGTFTGQNNLGKILMICRACLWLGIEPPIDYELLHTKAIHIMGRRLSFAA